MIVATVLSPIYVAFTLVTALLLWFVIGSRGKWFIKLPMIVLVPAFMIVVWFSLSSFSGWPTIQSPPKAALYVYGYAIEPDPNQNIGGAIYVWLVPPKVHGGVFDYAPKTGEPRSYKLPYSKQLEAQVQGANAAVAHGQQVVFAHASQKNSKGGHRGHSTPGNTNSRGQWHAYPLPPIGPPRKNTHG